MVAGLLFRRPLDDSDDRPGANADRRHNESRGHVNAVDEAQGGHARRRNRPHQAPADVQDDHKHADHVEEGFHGAKRLGGGADQPRQGRDASSIRKMPAPVVVVVAPSVAIPTGVRAALLTESVVP